jgi:hypothetical protein
VSAQPSAIAGASAICLKPRQRAAIDASSAATLAHHHRAATTSRPCQPAVIVTMNAKRTSPKTNGPTEPGQREQGSNPGCERARRWQPPPLAGCPRRQQESRRHPDGGDVNDTPWDAPFDQVGLGDHRHASGRRRHRQRRICERCGLGSDHRGDRQWAGVSRGSPVAASWPRQCMAALRPQQPPGPGTVRATPYPLRVPLTTIRRGDDARPRRRSAVAGRSHDAAFARVRRTGGSRPDGANRWHDPAAPTRAALADDAT